MWRINIFNEFLMGTAKIGSTARRAAGLIRFVACKGEIFIKRNSKVCLLWYRTLKSDTW
jgi:hypothetical protein